MGGPLQNNPQRALYGSLPLNLGGTANDLSASGGIGYFIQQPTAGGALVSQPINQIIVKADSAAAYPSQITIEGLTNPNQQVLIGYNTSLNYGMVTALTLGTAFYPLLLNPAGPSVGIFLGGGGTLNLPAAGTSLDVGGGFFHHLYNNGNNPPNVSGLFLNWNVSGGSGETDFVNNYSGGNGLPSFRFYTTNSAAFGTLLVEMSIAPVIDAKGTIRTTAGGTPASGAGMEMLYGGGIGIVQVYDRGGSAYLAGQFQALTLALNTSTNGAITTGTGLFTAGGNVNLKHLIGGSAAPTAAVGAAAGTGASIVSPVSGTDLSGLLSVTTGTATAANGILCTITFATAYGASPHVTMFPANANAADLLVGQLSVYATTTTTTFVVHTGTTAPTISANFQWYYRVSQ